MTYRIVVLSPMFLVIRNFRIEAEDDASANAQAEAIMVEKGWEDFDAEIKLYPEYDI